MRYIQGAIFLSLILLLLPLVSAGASISPPSGGMLSGLFVPGKVLQAKYVIGGAPHISAYLEGDLAEYATLADPDPDGPKREISLRIELPEHLDPGEHILYVIAKEMRPEGGMVGGVAAAVRKISILSLDPNPLLEILSFDVDSTALGDLETKARVKLHSLTLQDLQDVYARLTLKALDGEELTVKETNHLLLSSGESILLEGKLPTRSLSPGPYEVDVTVFYASNTTKGNTTFRVGTLEIELVSYTEELTIDKINRFDAMVKSNWNQPLEGTHAIIKVPPAEEQTPDVTLSPFGKVGLKTYLDMDGAELGRVAGSILVIYPGGQKSFPINVTLVGEQVEAATQAESDLQEPESAGITITLTPMVMLYFLLILLVLINLFLLFRQQKKKGDVNGEKKESHEEQHDEK